MSNFKPTEAETIKLAPQEGPQERFLASSSDITIYGGAAGGGKTFGLLLDPIRYIGVPGFNCCIFRRNSPMIRNPGALWDTSVKIYKWLNGKPTESRLTWKFPKSPSGAEIRFGHLEYEQDKYNWNGSQICALFFDELQEFTESMFFYMLSRNRSVCGVKPYVKCTCNPDADSWLREFLDWWIGEDGLPIKSRDSVERYFIRLDGQLKWASSKNKLLQYNLEFVKKYKRIRNNYLEKKKGLNKKEIEDLKVLCTMEIYKLKKMAIKDIKSVVFIASNVRDNKISLEKDPGYISNLMALPLIERARLLDGNWNIKPEAGLFFNKAWFNTINARELPLDGQECRFWDFAATAVSKKNKDPDFTCSIKIRKSKENKGKYFIINVIRKRGTPAEIEKLFLETSIADKQVADDLGIRYKVRWEEEGGSSGKMETYRLKSLLAGFDCDGIRSSKSKEARAKPLAIQAEIGNILLLEADWNKDYLNELHNFTDTSSLHDDQVDASSGAFNELCTIYIHPTIPEEENKLNEEELVKKRIESYAQLEVDFLNDIDI